jgi:ABC-type branched-subunit amino acid transport system substrate-binding protein
MGKKLFLIIVTVALASALILGGCAKAPAPAPEAKTFDLGVLEGLSGQFSEFTIIQVDGIQIAIDMINERGGITVNGQNYLINPVIEDGKNTPEGITAAATRLVYDRKLKFIVGCGMAHTVHAECAVTDPAGVVRSNDWNNGGSWEISANTPYALKGVGGTVEAAAADIAYLVKNYPDVKSVLNIMPDDGAIPDVGPKVAKFVEAAGLKMAGDTLGWALDTVDFYPVAKKAIERNADAWLVNPGWEAHVAFFLKGGREQGFNGVVMGNCGAFFNLGAASGTDPKVLTRVIMPGFSTKTVEELRALPDDLVTPLLKEVGERCFTKYGFYVPDVLKGFDCVWVLVQAIEKAQSFDPAVVAATWKKMDTMETAWGTGRLCGLETFGVRSVVASKRPMQVADDGVMRYAGMADMYLP